MAIRKNKEIQEKNNKQRNQFKRFVKWMWLGASAILVVGLIIMLYVSTLDLPSFDELENPDIDYASAVYADNGDEIGRFFVENRVAIPYDSLNPYLTEALVSTEDVRYYNHSGIDFKALMRVLVKTVILQQKSAGGGSTITQQLAKQLYYSRDFSGMGKVSKALTLISYKLREWMTAVRLERSYTKEEIIAMYLNNYGFLYGARGVQAAAETYFGKNQSDLSIDEAATLVGMLKNSALYNPIRFPEKATDRRNVVLSQMKKANHITQIQYDSLTVNDIDNTAFNRVDNELKGDAIYFRTEVSQWVSKLFKDNNITKPDGTLYNVNRDGLKIYTTINIKMQQLLEKAAREHMEVNQERFFRTWKNSDPWTYSRDGYPVEIKKESLERLVKSSDRYYSLQSSFLSDDIAKIQNEYNISLKDYDLDRMIKSANDPKYLANLEKSGLIDKEKADKYRKIIASDLWPDFVNDYMALDEAIVETFNEKVKMRVFTYENEKMEKDTIMTPLDSIKYHRMILQVGSIAIDPANGHVKAYVGGVNHKYFKYNHVKASRQVGSTFKPFLYATAIALQGFSPCFPVMDIQYTISPGESDFHVLKPWTPQNAMGEYTGENFTLYEALRKSKNTVSVYLMKQMGSVEPLRGIVNNMGIDSSARLSNGRYKVPKQPSIALGATDLTPMEMTAAYTTFSNNGTYNTPVFVTKIVDRNGKVLYQSVPKSQVALSEKVNYVIVEMLKKVVGGQQWKVKSTIGGKTGTTNDYTDGWFMGITPDLVVGTWVGGEDRWMRFKSITYGQGSKMARPIFMNFIEKLEESEGTGYDPTKQFYKPSGDIGIELDCEIYKKYQDNSDDIFFENNNNSDNDASDDEEGGFF